MLPAWCPYGDFVNDSDVENSFEKSPDGTMSGHHCFMTKQDDAHLKSESEDVVQSSYFISNT